MIKGNSIRLEHVSMIYDDHNGYLHVLEDIDTVIHPQEFLCVLGPSGCGKTTLLRVIAGLDQHTKGEIVFPQSERPAVGIVFQESNLMPWRSVLDNILLPLELNGTDPQKAREQAVELAELVGLEDFLDVWPQSLSGGMAQRVAIARAFIQDTDILLLDEPFGALDALTREQMGGELLRIWQVRKKTVVMVTHSISEALLLADRVLVLSDRPAKIILDKKVDLPSPRTEEARYSKQFQLLARELRSAIG
jgi:NitT/TauT family transport system ATP-binding protein